jgi:hypothetical protein
MGVTIPRLFAVAVRVSLLAGFVGAQSLVAAV